MAATAPPSEPEDRVVPLDGGRNFRDLGGYGTADGRTVRRGLLFRSGTLAHLTPADIAWFGRVGIHTICDLRDRREREQEPHPPGLGAAQRTWDYDAAALQRRLTAPDEHGARRDTRSIMLGFYTALPWTFAPQFGAILAHAAAGDLPLLVNCAGGKDRTGMAVALLLTALGVPRATVIGDYALSERTIDYERDMVAPRLREGRADGAGFHELAQLSVAERAPLLRSDPEYLAAAFAAIEARHGSVDAYLLDELGADAAMRARLRDALLE